METRAPAEDGASWSSVPPAPSATGGHPVEHAAADVAADAAAGAGELPAEGLSAGVADEILERLAALEVRLDGLDALVRDAVAAELREVAGELRRAVSELGRLLLKDLDRLTKVLAEHRDTIVERLTPEPDPAPPPPPPEDALPAEPPVAVLEGEEGRWRLPSLRRRAR